VGTAGRTALQARSPARKDDPEPQVEQKMEETFVPGQTGAAIDSDALHEFVEASIG
jgi:hypothetical protein